MSERSDGVGGWGRLILATAFITAGSAAYPSYRAIEYQNPQAERHHDVESASDALAQIESINPIFVNQKVEQAVTVLGDEGTLDDQLQALSQSLDNRDLDKPLTEAEKKEIKIIRNRLDRLANQTKGSKEDWAGIAGGIGAAGAFLMLPIIGGWLIDRPSKKPSQNVQNS